MVHDFLMKYGKTTTAGPVRAYVRDPNIVSGNIVFLHKKADADVMYAIIK